jgi:hypothetical protein
MTSPRVALVCVALAALLYVAVTRPASQALGSVGDEYARLRRERRAGQTELNRAERRDRNRQRAVALLSSRADLAGRPLTAIRRAVLARLSGVPVSDVRLEVANDRNRNRVQVRVEARGAFLDLAGLCARLAAPGAGLAIKSVTLARRPREERVSLTVEALAIGAQP